MIIFVWTIIIAWTFWQLVNIFRKPARAKRAHTDHSDPETPDPKSRTAVKKILDNEGEYVSFEEIR